MKKDLATVKQLEENIIRLEQELALLRKQKNNDRGGSFTDKFISFFVNSNNGLDNREGQFQFFFENSVDALGMSSSDGKMVSVNSAFLELFGYISQTDVIGKSVLDYVCPEDHKIIIENKIKREKGENLPLQYEVRGIKRNGDIFNMELKISLISFNDETFTLGIIKDNTRLIQTQEALFKSETRYKILFENSGTANAYFNTECRLITQNSLSEQQMGRLLSESFNQSVVELFGEEKGLEVFKRMKRIMETGKPETFETLFKLPIGEKWFRSNYQPLRDENDIIIGIQTISQDITELKRAEIQLKFSELKFRSILENSADVVRILDENGIIKYITPSVKRILGYNPDDLIGKVDFDLIHPNDLPMVKKRWKVLGSKAGPTENSMEVRMLHANGSWEYYETLGNNMLNDQQIMGFIVISRNISERKRSEEELRESEERFRLTFKTSPDSVNINRMHDGLFIEVNDGFERVMGYSANDVLGKTAIELNIWENPSEREKMVAILRDNGYCNNFEAKFKSKDGKIVTGLMSARVINLRGQPHIISITRDISERKIVEEKILEAKLLAEEADNLKTQFLYNMSHEIRTPMNAICGFSDLLSAPDITAEKRQKYSAIVQKRTNDLLALIEDILDISKIEVGQLQIRETPGDVLELLRDLHQTWYFMDMHGEPPKAVQWLLDCKISGASCSILTDFHRLRQILNNLLSNAYKYSDTGNITFGCFINEGKELEFYVKDSGIGIPREKFDIIFDRFRQLEEGYLNRKSGGTGLGLSIVKGLIKLMNGRIWLESELGVGSVFHFTIPYCPVKSTQLSKLDESIGGVDWSGKNILIVEDDEANAELTDICII